MNGLCLVVDDEPDVERLIRQRFRHEIKDGLLNFLFAHDGTEALDILRQNYEIDMVLTDINMPKMDGLTLLQHIQAINPVVRTIVISAYGDMGNIRTSMNRGAFDFIVKPIDFEDLRVTMDKTLNYVHQIKQGMLSSKQNSILQMYVNPNIVDILSKEEPNQQGTNTDIFLSKKIEATVMFVDVCRFTSISETEAPEVLSVLLNRYFDIMARIVIINRGIIDKFIGDSAMILFEGENHLARAISTGLDIIDNISKIVGQDLSPTSCYPHVSIGLNSGDMVSGNFGSTTIKRLDYTVIGDTVNTAARLESIAGDGQLFVSEEIAERVKTEFMIKSIGEMALKNKANPVKVYSVSRLQ